MRVLEIFSMVKLLAYVLSDTQVAAGHVHLEEQKSESCGYITLLSVQITTFLLGRYTTKIERM